MKVQIETISPYEKKIFLEIPSEIVSQEFDSSYRSLNRSVKLKGFRPGKVPRTILSRYYQTQVEKEVASKLISDSFRQAVAEHRLQPVAEPIVLDQALTEGKNFTCTLSLEVKPEVTVGDYLGLEIEVPPVTIAEEEIDLELKKIQEANAQLKPLDSPRVIREKDMVVLDFAGTISGKPLEGWKVNDHLVEAGSKTLIGDLDNYLIGLSPNEEKEVAIVLPANYTRKELAGKEISVHLKVKEVKEKILPSLDDEFAKDVGDYNTLAELKNHLRQKLLERKKAQNDQEAQEKILKVLIAKHPFPVPQTMIEHQVQNLIARAEIRLAREGMKLEEADLDRQKLRDSFRPLAENDVRGSLILEKIALKENLAISEAEQDEKLESLAKQINQRGEVLKGYYQKKNLMEDLRRQMLEEKTLDFLLSQAKIEEGVNAPSATLAEAYPEGKK